MSVSRRSSLPVYALGVLVGVLGLSAHVVVGTLRSVLHAQSAPSFTWEVIAQPEQVANVDLSIIRHVSTGKCLVIVQSAVGVSAFTEYSGDGLCDTPEEYAERKRKWEDIDKWSIGVDPAWRMNDEAVVIGGRLLVPSTGQTTKQPGVPK